MNIIDSVQMITWFSFKVLYEIYRYIKIKFFEISTLTILTNLKLPQKTLLVEPQLLVIIAILNSSSNRINHFKNLRIPLTFARSTHC